MIEYQTLITFRQTDNTMGVKTYNITKYEPISEGPIVYETSDLVTEFADGVVRMLRKVKLPKGTTMVNQVWQMEAKVMDGVPQKDNFKPLKSMGKVDLLSRGISATGSSTSRSKIVSEILAISILLFTQKLLSGSKNNFLGFIVAVILCTDLGGICGRAQLFHTATTPSGDLNLQLGDFVSGDVSYSFSLSILISSIRFDPCAFD
ncbi:cytochrome b561 and DOMON domain-containing protein At5g48750-like [Zingiber officinale]|uniref:cytochrome b561 and DOMON domain-containing protein At5g48750-like n=1 Tax=Zingiber officinale TaxID=94328 RepID=UPI001C4AF859|nr:cytochrome b561 and DOMON domain-containing protein At5g48750-like [Zingiber officinale]